MDFFSRIRSAFSKLTEKAASLDGGFVPVNDFMTASQVAEQNLLLNNKEWVFIAVKRVASAVAGVRYKVMRYENKSNDQEVFDGPLVDFLNKPSPNFTGKDFISLNTSYKELTGNAFWKIEDDKTLTPLISTNVRPIIKDGMLTGYRYTLGTKTELLLPENVLHDRYADPMKPYWGVGNLEKIARWVDTASYANEYNRQFFLNGASFGGFIETEEESKERVELIKTGLLTQHVGVKNAHKIAILPKGAKFAGATANMADMQFVELDDRYRDKILSGFGVPKTLVGLTTEVNRASAEASEYIFAKYTVKPIVDDFVEFLNEYVVPIFDNSGKFYIAYDDFIPENEDIEIRERQAALANAPYMTINEVRARDGLAPITGGDVVYGNPFQAPIGSPQEQKEVKNEARVRSLDEIAGSIAEKAAEIGSVVVDKDELAHKDFVGRVTEYQKQMAQKIKDFNLRQKAEVMQRLARLTRGVKKDDLFDYDAEVAVMVDMVSPLLKGLMTEQAIQEYIAQNLPGVFNPTDANISKIIDRSAQRMAKSYNDTTLNLLKQAINEGIQAGENAPVIAERINSVYEFSDTYRALMTAQTETSYAANEANKEAYKQSGVVKTIRWYTSMDERVCEFCGPLNGKIIDVEGDFFKRGEPVHGSDGGILSTDYRTIDVPPLHPNCNCFIRPETIELDIGKSAEAETKDEEGEIDTLLDEIVDDFIHE